MRVLIAGSSGFLGCKLRGRLRAEGHEVVRLVRREVTAPDEAEWNPATGHLDPAVVAQADAVVNLAGMPLGIHLIGRQLPFRPWTASYREQFRASRVDSTTTLARTIATIETKPTVFLTASAVGWYGDTGDQEVDEDAPAGDSFFADTARVWEAATGPAEAVGVRVAQMRIGFPLHRDGGYLGAQLVPFRLGLGGKIGSGRQWQPWISMTDFLQAMVFLLHRDDVSGPVNLVGPAPVTNAEFTAALGEELGRPTMLPMPAPVLRALLGDFGREVLASKRVLPGVLHRAGFTFTHRDLRSALQAALRD